MKKIISKDGTSVAFDQDLHRFGRVLNAVRPIANTVRVRDMPKNLQKYLK